MNISTTIKSIQDIMRQDAGVDGDAQRVSQLVWMIFLKVFDDKEKEWELEGNYKSPIPEKFRWRNWAADKEGITGDELLDFIEALFKSLKELSVSEKDTKGFIVKSVFEDSYNYMKSGTLIRQVINKLNEIDFNKTEDRHLFNDIYEKILLDLQSAGNAGEYYTPRAVTQFIVDMVNPKLGEKVLDPACGTGGFIICALENLKKKVKTVDERKELQKNIMGIEKKPLPHLLCMTNMILHDIEEPNIRHDNSLARPLRDYGASDMVDAVVTNPPFGGAEEPGIELNFPSHFRTRETADLFLVLIMKLLRDEGRCGLVLPDGFLADDGVKTRIRESLLLEFNLHTIVRLPEGVFSPYAKGVKTNLLFFEKGKATKEIWYFEHPLPEGYKNYSKTRPIRIEEFGIEKEWWNDRDNPKFKELCWKVNVKDIQNKGYNLDIKNPNEKRNLEFENPLKLIREIKITNESSIHEIDKLLKEIEFDIKDCKIEVLGDWLKQYRNTIRIKDTETYRQVTISQTGDVFFRCEKKGIEIGRKRQYIIDLKKHPNTLIFIRQGVQKGGIAIIPPELDGAVVTENMPMFEIRNDIDNKFLKYYLRSPLFKQEVDKIAPKGTAQKAIHEKKLLKIPVYYISKEEQKRVVYIIDVLERISGLSDKINENTTPLITSFYHDKFNNIKNGN